MKYLKRVLLYFLGMLLLATGIILNSKTNLGVSPIVSIAFCISVLRGVSFSDMTMVIYGACFVLELIVKGRRAKWLDVVQLPFCWCMTRFMALFAALLPEPGALYGRLLVLPLAILLTGAGIALMVSMRLVPNPSDGLVQAISDRTGKSVGWCKNAFDALCVVITLAIGLIAERRVIGIGVGTVAAVLLTGRAVALTLRLFGRYLEKTAAEAPIRLLGETNAENAQAS